MALGGGVVGTLQRDRTNTVYLNADRYLKRDWVELEVCKPHHGHLAAENSRAAYLRHSMKASGPKKQMV